MMCAYLMLDDVCISECWGIIKLEQELGNKTKQKNSFAFFTFYGYIANLQSDRLPDGLLAQLVEHCTGIAEVMGSNPVQAYVFFQALISQLLKLCVLLR